MVRNLFVYLMYKCGYVFIKRFVDSFCSDDVFHSDLLANAPSPYVPSTPVGQPMTPNSAAYLPGTPGGQPMTPGNVGMDIMSPIIGALLRSLCFHTCNLLPSPHRYISNHVLKCLQVVRVKVHGCCQKF
jgi:hypothetical protein